MSETPFHSEDRFREVEASGFAVPPPAEYTPEQREAMAAGPGQLEHPVEGILDFNGFEDFKGANPEEGRDRRNNFYRKFTIDRWLVNHPDLAEYYPIPAARERFKILFPDLFETLMQSFDRFFPAGSDKIGEGYNEDEELLYQQFVAYKLMRKLVDVNDSEDATDPRYLIK